MFLYKKVFNTKTNYLLVIFKNSEKFFSILQKKEIILNKKNHVELKNCIRITINILKKYEKKYLC